MTDARVMDHVVQRDYAGVGSAQTAELLVCGHTGLDRRHHVVVHRQAVEWCGRSVVQVVEQRRSVARLGRDWHEADRSVRPRHQAALDRALTAGVPDALVRRQVIVAARVRVHEAPLHLRPSARRDLPCAFVEACERLLERVLCFGQERGAGAVAPMAASEEQIEEI